MDLDKNVNQGSGSRVITLRLDGGGEGVAVGTWRASQCGIGALSAHLRAAKGLGVRGPITLESVRHI